MKRTAWAAAAVLALTAGTALASEAQWGYGGDSGPERWGDLDPSFALCAKGANQSPINLTGFTEAELEPLAFDYSGLATEVLNNGHAIQATYSAGSFLKVGGRAYELKQIHFHAPGEHQIEGRQFPLEAHLVHSDANGNTAVLAVLYASGEENPGIGKLWRQMPKEAGKKEGMASQVRAEQLLPENRDYYRLSGSLTTPPCSEGVLWLIMKNQSTVSEAQVKQLSEVMGHANNRPLQALNARAVLQ